MQEISPNPVIYFDGYCNLCNSFVNFIIRHDTKSKFHFASLQSPKGLAAIASSGGITLSPESVILFYRDKYYIKSDAALLTFKLLGGRWSLLYAATIVPKFLRDFVYKIISRNRYKWFGKRASCLVPTPDIRARFID